MYESVHKYFLQFMLKNSFVPLSNALEYCNLHTDALGNLTAFKVFISDINENITKQELKIVILKCEVTGDMKLALINTANDDISKLQTTFSLIELQYFQALLKEILITDDHRLQIMDCLNLSHNDATSIRKDNVEKVLEKWKNEGYIVEHESYVHLGPRCIAEFAPYFQKHCRDYYSSCDLCSEAVFTGEICNSCDKTMHKHCIQKYLQKHKNCPSCKTTWQNNRGKSPATDDSSVSSEEENNSEHIPKRRKTRHI